MPRHVAPALPALPALALSALIALALLAPPAAGSVVRDTLKEHESRIVAGAAADVPVAVPFHLEAPGLFYAKLLVTPWNAVNSGTPNGTVASDRSAGTSGWWVEIYLADESGAPLARDGNGASVEAALGAFVDSTPTRATFLAAGTPHVLQAIVHVPLEAAVPGGRYEVNLALVYREGAFTGDGPTSGARFEQSKAFTERIVVDGSSPAVPPTGAPPPAPPAAATPSPIAPMAPPESPSEAVARGAPAEAGLVLPLVLGLAIAALAVSVAALAVTTYVLLLVRRDLAFARSLAPEGPEAPVARPPERVGRSR